MNGYLRIANCWPKALLMRSLRLRKLVYEEKNNVKVIGKMTLISFAISAILFLGVYAIRRSGFVAMILGVVVFVSILLIDFIKIKLKVATKRRDIEEILPDWLLLVATNISSGMSTFHALQAASNRDFGVLSSRMQIIGVKSLGPGDFYEDLKKVGNDIGSPVLTKCLNLITTSLKSGTALVPVLEELAKDIATSLSLKKELETNTKSYGMFIIFTVAFGSPILFGVAIHFLETLNRVTTVSSDDAFGLGIFSGESIINPSFFLNSSIVLMIVTSLLTGSLLSAIKEGNYYEGLRYSPVLIFISVTLLFLVKGLLGKVI